MSCDEVLVQNTYARLFIAAAWNPGGVNCAVSLVETRARMGLGRYELGFVSGVSNRYGGKTEAVGESAKEDVDDGEWRPDRAT
jgi:hypothetical protein